MKYLSTLCITLSLTAISALAAPPDPAKLPPASQKTGLTFEKDIHPIMDAACVRCHGAQRPKAGLRLDTLEGILKGSGEHKIVEVGHGEQSRLVFSVASVDGKIFMPPKPKAPRNSAPTAAGATNAPPPAPAPAREWKPLTPEQVGIIRAWIDQGAK